MSVFSWREPFYEKVQVILNSTILSPDASDQYYFTMKSLNDLPAPMSHLKLICPVPPTLECLHRIPENFFSNLSSLEIIEFNPVDLPRLTFKRLFHACPQLRTLNLSFSPLGVNLDAFKELLNLAFKFTSVENLVLRQCQLGIVEGAELASLLLKYSETSRLQSLDICNNQLSTSIKDICAACKKLKVQKLAMENLRYNVSNALCSLLSDNDHLKELIIGQGNIHDDESLQAVCEAISPALEKLDLRPPRFSLNSSKCLVQMLSQGNVCKLSILSPFLKIEEFEFLCDQLKSCCQRLVSLEIGRNVITDQTEVSCNELVGLIVVLSESTHLEKLCLTAVHLPENVLIAINTLLLCNQRITHFTLKNCFLVDLVFSKLRESLDCATRDPFSFTIEGSQISGPLISKLCKIISADTCSLSGLHLLCKFESGDLKEFGESVSRNRSLTSLSLPSNLFEENGHSDILSKIFQNSQILQLSGRTFDLQSDHLRMNQFKTAEAGILYLFRKVLMLPFGFDKSLVGIILHLLCPVRILLTCK
jgi:hypothetical protein